MRTLKVVILLCAMGIVAVLLQHTMSDPQRAAVEYANRQLLDPLYAFPGTDMRAFRKALDAFELSAKAAVPMFPENKEAKEAIYPFRFLRTLPEAEEARRVLIADPSPAHARTYHEKLYALLLAHEHDLHGADAVLSLDKNPNVYQYFSGQNTGDSVQTILTEALRANATALKKEDRRFACFEGDARSCESLLQLQFNFGELYQTSNRTYETEVVQKNTYPLSVIYPSIETSPIFVIENSSCFNDTPAYFALTVQPSRLSEVPGAHVVYLNRLYVENTASSTHPFYKLLHASGVTLTFQPFNAYMCPDFGMDVGRILGMANLSKTLLSAPSTPTGFSTRTLRDLQTASEKFSMRPLLLQEHEYNAYLNAAIFTIRKTDPTSLIQSLGREEVIKLAERVTEARAKSSSLDLVLGYFDDLQIGSYIPYRLNPSPPSVFLITRGGLSQLYALDNETVFPSGHSLLSKRIYSIDPFKDSEIPIRPLSTTLVHQAGFLNERQLFAADIVARHKAFSDLITELKARRTILQ